VQPGEDRKLEHYRPRIAADLWPPFVWAATFGGLAGGALVWFGVPVRVSVGLGMVATAGSWLWSTYDLIWASGPNILTAFERIKRNPETPPPATPKGPPIAVDLSKRRGTGKKTKHLAIPCPAAGEEMLARWFWRVCRENGDRFSIRVAHTYHIMRPEAKAVQDYFTDNGLATKASNKYTPTDEGIAAMWGVVDRNIPDARPLSPDDVQDA
jgi:hypothetical protein